MIVFRSPLVESIKRISPIVVAIRVEVGVCESSKEEALTERILELV